MSVKNQTGDKTCSRTIIFKFRNARKIWEVPNFVMSLAITSRAKRLVSIGQSQHHPNGVSKVANGRFEGIDLATLYAEHRELFWQPS